MGWEEDRDFKTLVISNVDAMVVLDRDGHVLFVNPAAEALFDLPADQMIGQQFGFPVILHEPVEMYVLRQFKAFVAVEMRMVDITWAGQPSYLLSFRDLTDRIMAEKALAESRDMLETRVQERTAKLSATIRKLHEEVEARSAAEEALRVEIDERREIEGKLRAEIEQRSKTEEALEDAKSQAELYLDLISHDINNLNQIGIGFLELALETISVPPEEREFLTKPLDVLRNSSLLIQNVRKLQRAREGNLPQERIDLCQILEGLKKQYSQIPGRDISISMDAEAGCYFIGNMLIRDAFSNLIGNAIKHSSPEKPLHIGISMYRVTENGAPYYRIAVEDNGPGLSDGLKQAIFRKFRRGKGKVSGRGLGLYLVQTIIDDFNGRVYVEDRVPGDYRQGARFVVMLPEKPASGSKTG